MLMDPSICHLVEYLQTDIWVKSKMSGNDCSISVLMTQWNSIMLKAGVGITPEEQLKILMMTCQRL